MSPRDPAFKSAALLGSIALLALGGLGVLVSVVALFGLAMQERFTWSTANASFIILLCSAVLVGFGIILYRRAQR